MSIQKVERGDRTRWRGINGVFKTMLQNDLRHQLDVGGANEGEAGGQKYAPDRAESRDDLVCRDPLENVGCPHCV